MADKYAPGTTYNPYKTQPPKQTPANKTIAQTVPFLDLTDYPAEDFVYDAKGNISSIKSANTAENIRSETEKKTWDWLNTLNNAKSGQIAKGKKTINDAYASLIAFLSAQKNPWAGMKAQNTQVAPQLQQLLKSQNVNTTPMEQFASALNTQGNQQADAFQNLINIMGGLYGEEQQARKTTAKYDQSVALANLIKALGG